MKKNKKGFSLIEAIVGVTLLAFVLMTVISALVHQRNATQKTSSKNIAITLADMKLQEMQQYPAEQLEIYIQNPPHMNRIVEYIVYYQGKFQISTENPQTNKTSFRRTTYVKLDALREIATIQVIVDYGAAAGTDGWPFKVAMSTKRAGDFR